MEPQHNCDLDYQNHDCNDGGHHDTEIHPPLINLYSFALSGSLAYYHACFGAVQEVHGLQFFRWILMFFGELYYNCQYLWILGVVSFFFCQTEIMENSRLLESCVCKMAWSIYLILLCFCFALRIISFRPNQAIEYSSKHALCCHSQKMKRTQFSNKFS
jgi:hypothetical protein